MIKLQRRKVAAGVSEAGIAHRKFAVKRRRGKDEASILTLRTTGEKVFFGCVFALFALYAASLIFPFLYMFFNALKDPYEYLLQDSHLALPEDWLFSNFAEAFTKMKIEDSVGEAIYFPQMFFNSIWYSIFATASGVFASALTSYCIAKYKFKIRGLLYGVAIFSMTIPIVGNTGSFFKLIYQLGRYNSPIYPIITGFGGFGFNFLVLYGFFKSLPWSYAEATFIDGGGHATVFFKIMLPMAWPAMLTLCIMAFIGAWNDYMTMILYMPDFPTLASGLYVIEASLKRGDGGNYPVYYAALMISCIPIIVIFSVFSDIIMSNFTIGGLKG